jgi:hypothetical protein
MCLQKLTKFFIGIVSLNTYFKPLIFKTEYRTLFCALVHKGLFCLDVSSHCNAPT